MKKALSLLALVPALALGAIPAAADDKLLTVVELYTSQGCSSCPPADAYLGELAERDDVLALSFHVDYWDYIGWKDPFGSPRHTQRQRDYAQTFNLRYVYTPQMVIQGNLQATGSNRPGIESAIATQRHTNLRNVRMSLKKGADGRPVLTIPPSTRVKEELEVWLVVYDREYTTAVKRGENRGRSITNRNVVRALERIGAWNGEAMQTPLTVADMGGGKGDACAVILQSARTGHILGAAKLSLDGGRS